MSGVRANGQTPKGLGVRFPKAELYTVSTAAELVERHPDGACVHAIVPVEPAKRIASAIHVVDTIIRNHNRVAILNFIFGHGLISMSTRRVLCPVIVMLKHSPGKGERLMNGKPSGTSQL